MSQDETSVDVDDLGEASMLSLQSTTSTATASKRKAPGKPKVTRSKKPRTTKTKQRDPSPELDLEDDDGPNWEPAEMVGTPDSDRRYQQEPQQGDDKTTSIQVTVPPIEPSTPQSSHREALSEERRQSRPEPPRARRSETSSQQIFATPLSEAEPTRQETFEEVETENTPQASQPLGPPAQRSSPIPVKQTSPLKGQTNPPLSVVSSAQTQSATQRRSSRLSKQEERHPSPVSDLENAPPSTRPERVRPPLPSPAETQTAWIPADLNAVFQGTPARQLFQLKEKVTDQERAMTLQEWIEHAAEQAAEELRMEGERIVSIFEREGQRAMEMLEGISVI